MRRMMHDATISLTGTLPFTRTRTLTLTLTLI
jgi:hypothetical protein